MHSQSNITLKLDVIFKSFFTKHKDLLKNFLASVLEIPEESMSDLQFKNSEIPVDTEDDKFSRMDLNLKVNNKNVNIEMQINKEKYYAERAIFYWSRLYDDLRQGEDYGSIPDAISIHILDHKMFKDENIYQSTFVFMEKQRHDILSDKCAIHFFELPKLPKEHDLTNMKELWLRLISADNEVAFESIKKVGNKVMNEAVEAINEMQNDTYMREVARMRRKALNDEINSMSIARKEGEQIGLQKGRAEEKQKISLLTQILQKNNRLNELIPALQDEEKINALYKEFKIE